MGIMEKKMETAIMGYIRFSEACEAKYGSFHFRFHFPSITTIYYNSFHFIFHYPQIAPIF